MKKEMIKEICESSKVRVIKNSATRIAEVLTSIEDESLQNEIWAIYKSIIEYFASNKDLTCSMSALSDIICDQFRKHDLYVKLVSYFKPRYESYGVYTLNVLVKYTSLILCIYNSNVVYGQLLPVQDLLGNIQLKMYEEIKNCEGYTGDCLDDIDSKVTRLLDRLTTKNDPIYYNTSRINIHSVIFSRCLNCLNKAELDTDYDALFTAVIQNNIKFFNTRIHRSL